MDTHKCPKKTIQHEYEQLLRKHLGLLNIKIKVPVRDNRTLSLVYTPGVAASCLKIKANKRDSYKYTNKMNSMIIVSIKNTSLCCLPYLEAMSVYYKRAAHIDCYPITIDGDLIQSSEDLYETIHALMPAYSAVEFFNISDEQYSEFSKLAGENPGYAYINSTKKREIDRELSQNHFNENLSSNLIFSSILRAALDCQAYSNLNPLLEHLLLAVNDYTNNLQRQEHFHVPQFYEYFFLILENSLDYILNNNLSPALPDKELTLNHEEFSKEYVIIKAKRFLVEGVTAWVQTYPKNYISSQKGNDENSLLLHERYQGMIGTFSKVLFPNVDYMHRFFTWDNLDYIRDIIKNDPDQASYLTCKANLGAIITNGTAILGLGNIGALAGLPVMEGKSVLFKLYGGSDIVPICIEETNPDKFIRIVQRIAPSFSIINLEDIKGPDCFKIESTLNSLLDFSVFHDDQHGTAVVVLAGIINALKLRKSDVKDVRLVLNGAGAAGLSITQLLLHYGIQNIIICDTEGSLYEGRESNMNDYKNKLASLTNREKIAGKLSDVVKNSDIFVGVSAPKSLTKEMIQTMNKDPIIFALANPTPEIFPDEAIEAGAFIVATGRSDFPNQVNNSLAFPGIFRAAIDVKAYEITIEMKIAAAVAIANLINPDNLRRDCIIPGSLETNVSIAVTSAVAKVAFEQNNVRNPNITQELIHENIASWFRECEIHNFDYINKVGNCFNK